VSGGSLKIPRLQTALSAMVPDAEVLGLGPVISPDEVIAMGAAVQASLVPVGWNGDCIQLCEDVNVISQRLEFQVSIFFILKLCMMCVCQDIRNILKSD